MLRGWDCLSFKEGLRDLARLRLQPGHVPRPQLGQSQTIVVLVQRRQGGIQCPAVHAVLVEPPCYRGQLLERVPGMLVQAFLVVRQVAQLAQTLTPQTGQTGTQRFTCWLTTVKVAVEPKDAGGYDT